jgi:hypothetical protein
LGLLGLRFEQFASFPVNFRSQNFSIVEIEA